MESRRWLEHAVAANFPTVSAANVTIYPRSHELFISGRNVRCTRSQLRMLAALLSNFCKTVRCERLMSIKGRTINVREQNSLKVAIFSLRAKLRTHHAGIDIRNVYGTGYQAQPTELKR
jgi:DNA-binding response OmpR family regulator